tara:strand:- start:1976 stop:2971 length:996 start_codon:yes stop_codon:yes gene_type:complete
VPANLGKIQRYPEDLIDHKSDYFQIEVLKQQKSDKKGFAALGDIKETVTETEGTDGKKIKKTKTSGGFNTFTGDLATGQTTQASDKYDKLPVSSVIILPIPQNIKDSNGASWGESKLNDFAAWGLNKVGDAMNSETGMELLKSPGSSFSEIKDAAIGTRGGAIANYGKLVMAASAANALGANVTIGGLLSRVSGQVINQNLEMVFSGVTVRSFNFGWDLVPRSIDEAQVVKKILRTLKLASSAKMHKDNLGFLNAPDIFRIKYMKGGKAHPFLNRFKSCALESINVNYTGSGTYATYPDGTPVHMKMDLTFKELNPIYAEDHEKVADGGFY